MSDVINQYLNYTKDTEPPVNFHRWAFLSCVAAGLGRNVWMQFGPDKIFPHMYIMLVGAPGTRKSTSISRASKLLRDSGFGSFAFNKSSKQKFLEDFALGFEMTTPDGKFNMSAALDTALATMTDKEELVQNAFICADEFIDFIGSGNFDFISLLTKFWDAPPFYDERFKNSQSVRVVNPTVNILGGITPTNMQLSMPAEVIGHGFLSRFVLVYGEPTGRRITFPKVPKPEDTDAIVALITKATRIKGEIKLSAHAEAMLDEIYQAWQPLDDVRLQYYCGRRLTHLFKLCLVLCALDETLLMTVDHVIEANSILTYTELSMEKALGEFGKSQFSAASAKVLTALEIHDKPLTIDELYKACANDVSKFQDMTTILVNLTRAGKIICINNCFILKKATLSVDALHVNLEKFIPEYSLMGGMK
jgi:hypothetical protein